jgi:hypothetical protein
MRVASWRVGGEPGDAHRDFRPLSPLPAGRHKLVSVAIDR